MSSVGARSDAARKRGRRSSAVAITLALLSSITCRDRAPTSADPTPPQAQVTVAASRDTLRLIVEQTFQLTATVENPVGKDLPNKQHTYWTSTRPDLASVDSSGLVTAIDTGRALVIAVHKKSADTVRVHVVPIPVAKVIVTPPSLALEVGEPATLAAATLDSLDRPLTGRIVAWASSAPDVATVSSTGEVSGVAPGTATVSATSEGRTGTVSLTVLVPWTLDVAERRLTPGEQVQLHAWRGETVLPGVEWSTSDPAVAPVSATGLVTGLVEGTATISARYGWPGSATRTVIITVRDDRVASLAIAPRSITVAQWEQSQIFVASLRNASGRLLTEPLATWQWLGAPVAMLFARGDTASVAPILYSPPVTPASARLVATAGGKADTVSVTLLAARTKSVQIWGNPGEMPALYSGCGIRLSDGELRATPLDLMGNPIGGSHTYAWSTGGTGSLILRPSQSGDRAFITAASVGNVIVTATVDGVSGTTTIPIRKCAENVVTPGTATIAAGTSVQLTSTTTSLFSGTYVSPPPRSDIAWSSSNTGVATVDQSGRVIGVSPGTATISAAINKDPYGLGPSATGQATITVTPSTTTRVSITGKDTLVIPGTGCGYTGQSGRYVADAYDGAGTRLQGRPTTWDVGPFIFVSPHTPAQDTVALYVLSQFPWPPEGATTSTLRATVDGIQGTRTVTVSSCTIVSILPTTAIMHVGETLQLGSSLVTLFGGVPSPAEYSGTQWWVRTSPQSATITYDTGIVTALAPGTVTIGLRSYASTGTATITILP